MAPNGKSRAAVRQAPRCPGMGRHQQGPHTPAPRRTGAARPGDPTGTPVLRRTRQGRGAKGRPDEDRQWRQNPRQWGRGPSGRWRGDSPPLTPRPRGTRPSPARWSRVAGQQLAAGSRGGGQRETRGHSRSSRSRNQRSRQTVRAGRGRASVLLLVLIEVVVLLLVLPDVGHGGLHPGAAVLGPAGARGQHAVRTIGQVTGRKPRAIRGRH